MAATLALATPLALAGCGGGSSPAGPSQAGGSAATGVTLTALDYYNDQPVKGIWQTALTKCGTESGVKVTQNTVPGGNLIQKVLQEGSSKTLPDILMLDNPDLQQIAATGALSPLKNYGISPSGYFPAVTKASTYKGELYGLQPVTNTIGLFYNKDLLSKAGVTPPTTWAELQSDAKKLTDSASGRYGMAFSAINTYEGTWQFLPFMWSNGGDEKNIATPASAQALQLWVDMVNDGSVSKSTVNWTQADVQAQFAAGKAAMMVNGPWQFPVLDKIKGLNYGVVPIPSPSAGKPVVNPLGGETWTVPNTGDTAKQKAAAKVIQCLSTDSMQKWLADKNQTIPTKTAVATSYAASNPKNQAFAEEIKTARSRTGELGADWPKAATKIYQAIQLALVGGKTPMQALQQTQNG